jgi:hypothetical protein
MIQRAIARPGPRSEIDRMIDQGAAFRDVRPLFDRRIEAFEYFSRRQRELHGANVSLDRCFMCGARQELHRAQFVWRAMFRSGRAWIWMILGAIAELGHAHVYDDTANYRRFNTHHAICMNCWRSWRWAKIRFNLLAALAWLLSVAGTAAAVLLLPVACFGLWKPSERRFLMLLGWIGVPAAMVGFWLRAMATTLRAPAPLRHIPTGSIELEQAKLC